MGLLSVGQPLSWHETKRQAKILNQQGIEQFIEMYKESKNTKAEILRWGDEIEYMVVAFDHENKIAQLSLVASKLLPKLSLLNNSNGCCSTKWVYEFAEYMVEATPGNPYQHAITDIRTVECNMRRRRKILQSHLSENEYAFCITAFPRNGCSNFTKPSHVIESSSNKLSSYIPVEAITQGHPRFRTLAENIRQRRGDKVRIDVPIFKDVNTMSPFIDWTAISDQPLVDHIYMDAMGFGMGSSCLQVTFQAADVNEARYLYDQLCPLTPILLAMTAASPIWKGFLSDVDCRWDVISASVDDRNINERDPTNPQYIPQSRYGSIDCYLSKNSDIFNDIVVVKDENHYKRLISEGFDHLLAQHISHLFIRDPLVAFLEQIDPKPKDLFHFETIQSTNWNNMRFKIPPANSSDKIGWRVEFRPCELQFTEFENAAFVIFIIILTRAILSFPISFLVPISIMQKNMKIAQKRDAVLNEKFAFRVDCGTCDESFNEKCCNDNPNEKPNECFVIEDMTVNEIINGLPNKFIGLIPLVRIYLEKIDVDYYTSCRLGCYLHFISCRASGKLITNARWIRNFVDAHRAYKHDSVISDLVNYDLLMKIMKLSEENEQEDVLRRILHEYSI
ncbi:hypothetical protein GJ496_007846 [Pomphorhynchus laevis]|nr:hypothetical protein GJ496_007846 [Pomphorhynchus laevis]